MGTAKNTKPRKSFVNLKAKGAYAKEQKFSEQQALVLLRLPNSAWELNDEKYTFEKNDLKRNPSKGNTNKSERKE